MRRLLYMVAFTLFACAAALLTLRAQHTVGVVVALHDVRAGAQLQADDVEVRHLHDDGAPDGALSSVTDAVGRYVAWPLTAGEPVLGRELRADHAGGAVVAGMVVPAGYRAVAVPVQPAGAVGGMLTTGDHVDVFATPQAGRDAPLAGAGAAAPTPGAIAPGSSTGESDAVVLGRDVLVLELRSDQGRALDAGAADQVHGLDFGSGRLGSVVLAVPEADVDRYASAAAVDVIYLALSFGS